LNVEAFCYLGLLRFPAQVEASLAVLPQDQRDAAQTFIAAVKDLPKPELVRRWSKLRESEAAKLRRSAREKTGVSLDELAPATKRWCLEWLIDQDGRENH
jgi:hypothetical protein